MDEKSPKISFIPKGSLVREESFLERPRPRSAIGALAIFMFAAALLGYVGLYLYNNYLENQIATKLGEVQKADEIFKRSPQVEKANNFRFRADIVRQLLNSHVSVSPILKFLSDNTLSSIMYSDFSYGKDAKGVIAVKLSGEAPTYSALAYQREVFRGKTELSSFDITEVGLSSFGTVSFKLTLIFTPSYLSYIRNITTAQTSSSTAPFIPSQPMGFSPTSFKNLPTPVSAPTLPPTPRGVAAPPPSSPVVPTLLPPAGASRAVPPPPAFTSGTSSGNSALFAPGQVASTSGQAVGNVVPAPAPTPANPSTVPTTPAPPVAPATQPSFWASFWAWFKFW